MGAHPPYCKHRDAAVAGPAWAAEFPARPNRLREFGKWDACRDACPDGEGRRVRLVRLDAWGRGLASEWTGLDGRGLDKSAGPVSGWRGGAWALPAAAAAGARQRLDFADGAEKGARPNRDAAARLAAARAVRPAADLPVIPSRPLNRLEIRALAWTDPAHYWGGELWVHPDEDRQGVEPEATATLDWLATGLHWEVTAAVGRSISVLGAGLPAQSVWAWRPAESGVPDLPASDLRDRA